MLNKEQFLEVDWKEVYIKDIVTLLKLPVSTKDLLYELAKLINLQNIIILKNDLKKTIAQTLRISIKTLDDYLTILIEWGILERTDKETFKLDSRLFNPKDWIGFDCRHQESFSFKLQLKITYLSNGEKKIEIVSLQESN